MQPHINKDFHFLQGAKIPPISKQAKLLPQRLIPLPLSIIMITHIQRTSTDPILRIQSDFTGVISAKNSRTRHQERVPLACRLCLLKNQAMLEALRSGVKAIRRRKGKDMTPGAKPNNCFFSYWQKSMNY